MEYYTVMDQKVSWAERDPQISRWDQRRCPPSSGFSCSWLNVLTPFAKLWGSADPSQFSDLTKSCPNIFCWVINFSAWPHLSKSVCLLPQPSLPPPAAPRSAEGVPAALAMLAWLLLWCQCQNWSNPSSLCFPASAAALQSRHKCVCSHRANRSRDGLTGMLWPKSHAGQLAGQGSARMEQLGDRAGLRQLKEAVLGVQPQPTAALLPQTIQAFSPAAGSEGQGGHQTFLVNIVLPPDPLPRPQKGNSGHLYSSTVQRVTSCPVYLTHLCTLKHPLKTPLPWATTQPLNQWFIPAALFNQLLFNHYLTLFNHYYLTNSLFQHLCSHFKPVLLSLFFLPSPQTHQNKVSISIFVLYFWFIWHDN